MLGSKRSILTKLELHLMKVIWKQGKATVHEVQQALNPKDSLAYTTILTMLRVLEKKGFLKHDVDGRTYVYYPTIKQDEVTQGMVSDLLDRLFDGSKIEFINALLDVEKISQDELQTLKQLIDEKEKRK